jgi:hypothetical protein
VFIKNTPEKNKDARVCVCVRARARACVELLRLRTFFILIESHSISLKNFIRISTRRSLVL